MREPSSPNLVPDDDRAVFLGSLEQEPFACYLLGCNMVEKVWCGSGDLTPASVQELCSPKDGLYPVVQITMDEGESSVDDEPKSFLIDLKPTSRSISRSELKGILASCPLEDQSLEALFAMLGSLLT